MSVYKDFSIFVCSLVFCVHLSRSLPFQEYGVVYANNGTFRFVGETLELYCNITNKDVRENSSMLHFERSTKTDINIIPAEYVEILNTRAARLRIRNLAIDDDGVYTCFQETLSGETRVLGSQTIKIDNKPQSVKDISCRVHNWDHMRCTWSLGVKFQHPEFIKVSFVWTIHGEQQDCPKLTSTSCLWDSKTYQHGHLYLMVLEVETVVEGKKLMQARSPQFKIDTNLYVEPAPVNNLQATVDSSTCVYLTWQHSSEDWLKFFVAESKAKGKEKWNQIILDQEQEQEDYHSAVCSLTPFTDYEFRMSVLPFPVETVEPVVQGYKSEWKTVTAKTLEDIPSAAPKICSGCFYEYKCPQKRLHRCVRIYWQSLRENEKCGILTNYNITYASTETGIKHSLLLPVTESRSDLSVDLELTTFSQSFTVIIVPGTSQGFSKSSSTLFLPSAPRKPNPPSSFLVEWDEFDDDTNTRFYLSWAALNVDPKTGLKYTNVSVVWCCGHRQKAECQSDINWVKLPADHVTYELQPGEDNCHHSNYLIGVTAEAIHDGHVTSSGIYWSSCVYLRNQKPQNSPRNVRQSPAHPKNGLIVQWDKSECRDEESFITEYLVMYCPLYEDNRCMESEKSLNVSNTMAEVTLNHLKEDVRYKVSVIAVSSAGLGPSEQIITQTVKGSPVPEPDIDRSIGIIVGVFSFVIFLGIVAALSRYCLYWRKKVSNTENLIQPYAQTGENIHGSDEAKVKKIRQAESCSEDSVTSQSNLLLNLVQLNQSPLTSQSRAKRGQKKDSANKVSKGKGFPVKEIRTPQKSSRSSNDANYHLREMKNPYPENVPLLLSDNSTCGINSSRTKNSWPLNKVKASSVGKPSSNKLNKFPHNANGELGESISETNDPSVINFSKLSTLPLRRHSMELPNYQPLRPKMQTVDPFLSSVLENNKMEVDYCQCTDHTMYVPKNSSYVWRHQISPHNHYSMASNTGNLQTSAESQHPVYCSKDSDYAAHPTGTKASFHPQSNNLRDYSQIMESLKCKRHSAPLESFLYFPPALTSPPQTCPEDGRFTTAHFSSTHRTSCDCHCQCPSRIRHPDSPAATEALCPASNGHSQHHQLLTASSDNTHTASPAGFPAAPYKYRIVPSYYSSNISPTRNPANYPDSPPYIRSFSNEGLVDPPQYDPAVSAHTFPRNAGKESNILQLPIHISRPLSGDLLDLPPEYYQDPQIGGSNQIFTEL